MLDLGGKAVTCSDSAGFIYDEAGIDREKLAFVMELKNVQRGRINEYAEQVQERRLHAGRSGRRPQPAVGHQGRLRLPERRRRTRSTPRTPQNLLKNGVYVVSEGANMPTVPDGVEPFLDARILYGPGKAANAGGVATSGLEMSQNSLRLTWTREEVDKNLHGIMKSIHKHCVDAAETYGTPGNYVNGANIAGFLKVADAMMDQGVV